MEDVFKQFISVAEARQIILGQVWLQPVEAKPLHESVGYTLAEPVDSRDTIPPFDNSAMDGFAVRVEDLADLPATLRVIEEVPAGVSPQRMVQPGTCIRIMTGAPFPKGADAVVPVEWTEPVDGSREDVRFNRSPEVGQHIRPAGQDLRPGQRVFEAGQRITPPTVGMLGALGLATVPVRTPPTVAVVATGDELVDISERPGPGQIRNANGPALAAQAEAAGGGALPPLLARDDPASIRACLESARGADVLVLSGGVSVGDYDFVKQVLDDMGMRLLFWKVRQRPGKPLAFGVLGGQLVFGLPGNPVSSAVCFEQYVRPALAAMLGRSPVMRPLFPAELAEPIRKAAGLYHFVRGQTRVGRDGRVHVRTTGAQGSNLYSSFAYADCLIHLPEELEHPPAGTAVHIEWLHWL